MPIIFSWIIFILVIFQVPYPDSITQARLTQLLPFFISLFLAFGFTFNIFFQNIFISLSISLGIIILLLLKALGSLNLATGALTLASTGLLISYFRKIKKRNLTKLPKIPKLTKLRRDL